MLHDLETPMFTQKQVLRMLPDMKAKTLQNWAQRGILDVGDQKPGKQGRRLYTPVGVVMLDFMHRVGLYGVPPERAAEMADHVAEAALQFWKAGPEIIRTADGKSDWIPVTPDRMKQYRKARIVSFNSVSLDGEGGQTLSYLKFEQDLEDPRERMLHTLSLVVEVDFNIAQAINRMFLLEAGEI